MNHLHEVIKVYALFDPTKNFMSPLKIEWRNRIYEIKEIALHYTELVDGAFTHVFNAITEGNTMQLYFNTKTLVWTVERAQDSELSA